MRVPAPNHKANQWTSQGSHAAESQYSAAWLPMLMTTPMKRTPLYVRANLRWNKASSRAACSTAAIFARLLEGQAQAQARARAQAQAQAQDQAQARARAQAQAQAQAQAPGQRTGSPQRTLRFGLRIRLRLSAQARPSSAQAQAQRTGSAHRLRHRLAPAHRLAPQAQRTGVADALVFAGWVPCVVPINR